ncbi:hypothetical protein ACB092_11G069700 [Castanea dentata]
MSGCNREPVKVVIINTRYVETDAMTFKSVVQNLTGKDSTVAEGKEKDSKILKERMERTAAKTWSGSGGNKAVLMKNLSFKEFDELMREMPPMYELWE